MNEKTVAKVLLKASELLKADSDYVYDPEHKNRPHGGGTWYKTPKGWTTNKPSKSKQLNTSTPQKELTYQEFQKEVDENGGDKYGVMSDYLDKPNLSRDIFDSFRETA